MGFFFPAVPFCQHRIIVLCGRKVSVFVESIIWLSLQWGRKKEPLWCVLLIVQCSLLWAFRGAAVEYIRVQYCKTVSPLLYTGCFFVNWWLQKSIMYLCLDSIDFWVHTLTADRWPEWPDDPMKWLGGHLGCNLTHLSQASSPILMR